MFLRGIKPSSMVKIVPRGSYVVQASTMTSVTSHITDVRFATYLALTNNDPYQALLMYRWNIEMGGALQEALSVAEVFLRNTMDPQLRKWNAAQPRRQGGPAYNHEWVKHPAGPLYAILNPRRARGGGRYSTYDDVRRRAQDASRARPLTHRRYGHPVDHDDVVAHMTFGTWKRLLPGKDLTDPSGIGPHGQRQLWQNALEQAFPHHPDPIVINYWVDRLHNLRNRVAHLEPLCDIEVMSYHRTIARLLRSIDPALASWYSGISRVPELWRQKPTR